jgi:phage shock protein A
MEDLKNTFKAKVCDYKYSSFLSSFVIAWIFFNSKLILIYFDPKLPVKEKISMLSWSDINYEYPLYIALFYTVAFPLISIIFYAITLGYEALKNLVQQKIQDKNPIPHAKAKEYRKRIRELQKGVDEAHQEVEKIQEEFKEKEKYLEEVYNSKNELLDKNIQEGIADQTSPLEERINDLIAELDTKNKLLTESNQTIDVLDLNINEQTNQTKKLNVQIRSLKNEIKKHETTIKEYQDRDNENRDKFNKWLDIVAKKYNIQISPNDRRNIFQDISNKQLNMNFFIRKDQAVEVDPIVKAMKFLEHAEEDSILKTIFNIEIVQILNVFYSEDSLISIKDFKNIVENKYHIKKTITDLRIEELINTGILEYSKKNLLGI